MNRSHLFHPLLPPDAGVPVALLLCEHAIAIDFASPWKVIRDAWGCRPPSI